MAFTSYFSNSLVETGNLNVVNLVYGAKSKRVFWGDLVRYSDFFCDMKESVSQDNINELLILDVEENEFDEFLRFFIPPDNLIAEITMNNVSFVVKLADRFLCPSILKKCEKMLRDHTILLDLQIPNPHCKTNRSIVCNLIHRYFPTLQSYVSHWSLSQIDLSTIENLEYCRNVVLNYVRKVDQFGKLMKQGYQLPRNPKSMMNTVDHFESCQHLDYYVPLSGVNAQFYQRADELSNL